LPGIGATTAAAIAAIAHGAPVVAVDATITRVLCRLRPPADMEDLGVGGQGAKVSASAAAAAATRHATVHAQALVAGTGGGAWEDDPGDLVVAVRELGATICTAAAPACGACPVRGLCAGAAEAAAACASPPSYVTRWPRQGVPRERPRRRQRQRRRQRRRAAK